MTTQMLGLISYLVLTFSIAWGLWALFTRHGLSPKDKVFQLAILPGAIAPAVVAVVVRLFITREGLVLAEFIPSLSAWPVYAIGWLLPVVIVALTYLVVKKSRLSRFADEILSPTMRLPLLAKLPFVALVLGPLMLTEELGWRVFFQARVFPSSPLVAAVITGVVWAIWHWPLIRVGYGYPTERGKGFAAFTLWSVLLSIFLGWVYAQTGDVWGVSLAHMANNVIGASAISILVRGDRKRHLIDYGGLVSAAILAVVCGVLVLTGGVPW
ncbi:CPBP family intramembrane glutamic endopeptidase [Candidatus Bipolaricaulota bacterium]